MKILKIFGFVVIAALFMQSCTIAKISSKGSVPILLNQPAGDELELAEHVVAEKMIKFDYTASYDAYDVLSAEIASKKPDAVANVTITLKSTVKSYLLNTITCGFAAAKVMQVEADFMKYADPNNPKKKKGRK
ncbi:MAG: hypothetical protein ACXWDO_07940 [Bacteroidia bacterium]